MRNISEIEIASSDKKESAARTDLVKRGLLKKIAPRIYTTNLDETPEVVIRRNIFSILGQLYPEAVVSHRSAYELKPTEEGDFFLTYKYTKNISLPGITVHLIQGPDGMENDMPFIENLYISSAERRVLENLQKGRARTGASKCLPRQKIEENLEKILITNGESGLNAFRDRAKNIAATLGMNDEFDTLNAIIGAILQTRPSSILTSSSATARARGIPYDLDRLKLFEILFESLHNEVFQDLPEKNVDSASFRNFAFFESYFSNYIEGTEFDIEDARRIIDTGQPLPARNADSHDVLGTFRIVASKREMSRVPASSDELIGLLQERHRIMMSARPDRNPGAFKMSNNHAGDTHFVDYALVQGTLKKGFEYYHALEHPFAKAIFIMFMVSEVHPFNDGNGRLSRIMMNAELVAGGQSRIIIPTVFRDDYLNALRRLTRRNDSSVLIRALSRARLFSSKIRGDDFDETMAFFERSNAFKDEDGYILRF